MEVELLEKTELFFSNIGLKRVNLDDVAGAVADVLGLARRDVAVIDVQSGTLTVDILRSTVTLENILGRKAALEFSDDRKGNFKGRFISSEKAKRMLDWEPELEYEEAMSTYVAWYLKNQ